MSIMKVKQMRGMSQKDLDSKMSDLKLELMKDSSNVKMGKPVKNTGRIGEIKRAVARILTVKREMAINRAKMKVAEVKQKTTGAKDK